MAGDWALFLDLDGTLIDIAESPDAVRVAPGLPDLLADLDARLSGAVAIVTGRPVAFVDSLLPGNGLTVVGMHGARFRAGRRAEALCLPSGFGGQAVDLQHRAALDVARAHARIRAARLTDVLFEEKGEAFALHYRLAPEHEAAVRVIMAEAAQMAGDGFLLRPGKCVVELCPAGRDKGQALTALMAQRPFAGRRPLAAGDDLTDEAMFAAATLLGGMSIGIGDRPGSANAALATPADLHRWLKGFLE